MSDKGNDRITDFIIRYEKIFTREECRQLIEKIDFYDDNALLYPQPDNNKIFQDQDAVNVFSDSSLTIPESSFICQKIFQKINPCVDDYLNKFPVLGRRKFSIHDIKLKKIKCGAGFHSWHYENGNIENSRRTFVIQVYVNDDFDGGETEFLYQNKREKAVAGDVLIFPCQYTHVHRGNPPIDGDKYLVTSWAWLQE